MRSKSFAQQDLLKIGPAGTSFKNMLEMADISEFFGFCHEESKEGAPNSPPWDMSSSGHFVTFVLPSLMVH
jgi:hypothetical protein